MTEVYFGKRIITSTRHEWTDQKIKVHTFIYLIELLLSRLLWKNTKEPCYRMNVETLLEQLSDIRLSEIFTVLDLKKKPTKEKLFEDIAPEIEILYNTLAERDF